MKTVAMLKVLGLMLLGALTAVSAAVGDLDTAFGQAGRLEYPSGFGGMIELSDGSLQLVAVPAGQVKVLRFDPRGQPLAAFGSAGLRTFASDAGPASVLRAVAAPDGSSYMVLRAGLGTVTVQESPNSFSIYNSNEARILKLSPAGEPDPAFGTHGTRSFVASLVPRANLSQIDDVALASDGSLFVSVGYHVDFYEDCLRHSVFKFRVDGTLDAGFANAGEYRGTLGVCGDDAAGSLIAMQDGGVLIGPPARLRLDGSGRVVGTPPMWQQLLASPLPKSIVRVGSIIVAAEVAQYSPLQVTMSRWRDDLSPLGQWTLNLDSLLQEASAGSAIREVHLSASTRSTAMLELGMVTPQQRGDSPWQGFATYLLRLDDAGAVDAGFGSNGVVPGLNADAYIAQLGGGVLVDRRQDVIRLSDSPVDSPGALDMSLSCVVSQTVAETQGSLRVTVLRHLGSKGAVGIRYRLQALDATPGIDYGDVAGLLAWADGEVGGKGFEIPIFNDIIPEPSEERFKVLFESATGGAVVGCASSEVVIRSTGATVSGTSNGQPVSPTSSGSNSVAVAGGGGVLTRMPLVLLLVWAGLSFRQRYSRSFRR